MNREGGFAFWFGSDEERRGGVEMGGMRYGIETDSWNKGTAAHVPVHHPVDNGMKVSGVCPADVDETRGTVESGVSSSH